MLAFCAALVAGMALPFSLRGLSLLAAGLLAALAARGYPAATATAASAIAGLLLWQTTLNQFRLGQAAWIASGEQQLVLGTIASLPGCDDRQCRFQLRASSPRTGLLTVSWRQPPVRPSGGDRCALLVTVRPHWSLLNPAGFDRESWAFSRSLLADARVDAGGCRAGPGARAGLLRFRQALSERLAAALEGPAADLLPALVTGDRRALGPDHWRVLTATGTAHLMAISGLHVTLVAGSGLLAARLLLLAFPLPGPRQVLAAGLGAAASLAYATLAGWSVSTQRACLMLLAPLGAVMLRRPWQAGRGLLLALTLILLAVPESAAGRGLWMSFGAAAVLLGGFAGRPPVHGRWWQLVPVQLLLLAGLWPLQQALGLPYSPGFLLVNLLAVPWVSLLILPLTLAGTALLGLGCPWGLELAGWQINQLWEALRWVEPHLEAEPPSGISVPVWLTGLIAAALLLPRNLPGWWLLPPAMALVLLSASAPRWPAPELQVFDVGQGTAALAGFGRRTTLIDTGPGAAEGWNAGSAVLAPSLQRQGIATLNQVVLSHTDADHAGGLRGITESPLALGELVGVSPDGRWKPCRAGQAWRWDGLELRAWHPSPWLPYLGNDSSCVLTLRRGGRQLVLPGDAGVLVERRLLRRWQDQPLITDLLLLGHHGSRTSSSHQFLQSLQPGLAVATSGHQNRFDMPHRAVRRRLAQHRVPLLVSAECGHLAFRWDGGGLNVTAAARLQAARAWHWPGLCPEPAPP